MSLFLDSQVFFLPPTYQRLGTRESYNPETPVGWMERGHINLFSPANDQEKDTWSRTETLLMPTQILPNPMENTAPVSNSTMEIK